MAIKTLSKLKEVYPESKLIMIGPEKDNSMKECKDLIDQLELNDSVEITGVLQKEIWHEKSRDYDIFLNTTNYDNTPVSLIEAMALGIPIVSTNAGGIPFLIENGKEGLLVEKNDVEDMYISVRSLLENKNLAQRIARNGRQKIISFDWSVVKHQWEKVFNDRFD